MWNYKDKFRTMRPKQHEAFKYINSLGKRSSLVFAPGAFFVLLALITLLAPGFLIAVLAGIFLFIGISFCILAWKFMQFKKKAEQFAKQFQGRVFIHGLDVQDPLEEEEFVEEKKVVFH